MIQRDAPAVRTAATTLVAPAPRPEAPLVWRRALDAVLGAGLVDVIDSSDRYEVRIWYPCGCTASELERCRYAVEPCTAAHASALRAYGTGRT
jgi:hypothetical protein